MARMREKLDGGENRMRNESSWAAPTEKEKLNRSREKIREDRREQERDLRRLEQREQREREWEREREREKREAWEREQQYSRDKELQMQREREYREREARELRRDMAFLPVRERSPPRPIVSLAPPPSLSTSGYAVPFNPPVVSSLPPTPAPTDSTINTQSLSSILASLSSILPTTTSVPLVPSTAPVRDPRRRDIAPPSSTVLSAPPPSALDSLSYLVSLSSTSPIDAPPQDHAP
jgi:hypothetical protein